MAHEWVADEYAGGAGVAVFEGGGNAAVEVDTEEDGNFAKVAEDEPCLKSLGKRVPGFEVACPDAGYIHTSAWSHTAMPL
jgi:hypothetical protein